MAEEEIKIPKPAALEEGTDRETQMYRELVQAPTTFEDGFNLRTFIGVLFVAIVMMPTAIYLGLTMGLGLGPAAEWVTIILFADIARRSFKPLKRQEIYMLYYVAASLMMFVGGLALSGGHFAFMIWKQYLANTPFAQEMGIAPFPSWFVPAADSEAVTGRNFFHIDWVKPIMIMVATTVFGRVAWVCMGYTLFRVTSDVERLPFPMASIASEGATRPRRDCSCRNGNTEPSFQAKISPSRMPSQGRPAAVRRTSGNWRVMSLRSRLKSRTSRPALCSWARMPSYLSSTQTGAESRVSASASSSSWSAWLWLMETICQSSLIV